MVILPLEGGTKDHQRVGQKTNGGKDRRSTKGRTEDQQRAGQKTTGGAGWRTPGGQDRRPPEGRREDHKTWKKKITTKYYSKYISRPDSPLVGQNNNNNTRLEKETTRKSIKSKITFRNTTCPNHYKYLVFALSPIFPVWEDNWSSNPGGSPPIFFILIHSSLKVDLICRSNSNAGTLSEGRGWACLRVFELIS